MKIHISSVCLIGITMTAFTVWASCPNMKSDTVNNVAACTDCATGNTSTGSCSYNAYNAYVNFNCNQGTYGQLVNSGGQSFKLINCTVVPMTGGTCSGGVCSGASVGAASDVSAMATTTEACTGV
jgi:hypothetical protein